MRGMSLTAAPRHTADERREEILEAALIAFADTGLDGTSTETIARAVGISQPYLFRLFGTKKELFLTAVQRCFEETTEAFRHALEHGDQSEPASKRMGNAYVEMIRNRPKLRMQMQAYAACEDPDVRETVQRGFGELITYIRQQTGFTDAQLAQFMARGMLLNVMAAMDVLESDLPWVTLLREGCMGADA